VLYGTAFSLRNGNQPGCVSPPSAVVRHKVESTIEVISTFRGQWLSD
ncbi:hypothetical protein QE452_003842, partial [Sphingomonas sp. SORGH_AS438]|nr:hypothetical protein [Sphingomonas sp. SORGH_AS_0438]